MKRAAPGELIDYDKIVSDLNKYFRSKEWFICYDCNELIIDEDWGLDIPTSKNGDKQAFCDVCVLHCKYCGEDYSRMMRYKHDDCRYDHSGHVSSSSSSSSEDTTENEQIAIK